MADGGLSPSSAHIAAPESDSGVLRTQVRPGFKREFSFAMRSQSELGAFSDGRRTRARGTTLPQPHEAPSSSDEAASVRDPAGTSSSGEGGGSSELAQISTVEELLAARVLDGRLASGAVAAEGTHPPTVEGTAAVQKVTESEPQNKSFTCEDCGETFSDSRPGKPRLLCDSCHRVKRVEHSASTSNVPANTASTSYKTTLPSDGKAVPGRVRRKDLALYEIFSMQEKKFDLKVKCRDIKGDDIHGELRHDGILCSHCGNMFSPSSFEAHAGFGRRRKPYSHIYIGDKSLEELWADPSKLGELKTTQQDDLCVNCKLGCSDGKEILFCTECARMFHIECLNLSSLPEGEWLCKDCDRTQAEDPVVQKRILICDQPAGCITIACELCSQEAFLDSDVAPCELCRKVYHIECLAARNGTQVEELGQALFCSVKCRTISATFEGMVKNGAQSLESENLDLGWRLLIGINKYGIGKQLLSEAESILSERFDFGAKKNLLSVMVDGYNCDGQDFTGMHCAVLTVGPYVKTTAVLRILDENTAELPLAATRADSQNLAVAKDNKQRFSLLEENGELFIRANQGHTITTVSSESLLKSIISADEVPVCVHGTYKKNLESILQSGLKRMSRLHVHFSSGLPADGEVISGMRRDVNILIFLDVRKALEEGMKLYISDNRVILTEGFDGVVPVKYFEKIETWPQREQIQF